MNEVRMYSDELLLADLQALVSNACNNPCPVCPTTSSPNCIETVNDAYIGQWDFALAAYNQVIPDTGPNGLDFELLDDQASYDPIFVDNQGLYFDGTSHVRTTGTFTQDEEYSITLETWIRPASTTLGGELFAFEQSQNVNDASISLQSGSILVTLGTATTTIPLTYTAADVDTWQYVGVSLQKLTATTSKVCAVFGTGAESCQTINSILTLTGANSVQIGKNFKGMIKDMNVYDWPKTGYEFSDSIQVGGCTAWNGVACTH